ncbi:hypothetical protein BJ944DRAFT_235751, partial [Cunninghamella echinulata]
RFINIKSTPATSNSKKKKYESNGRKVPKTKFLEFINNYWKPENREASTNSESFNEDIYMENIYRDIRETVGKLMGSYLRGKSGRRKAFVNFLPYFGVEHTEPNNDTFASNGYD